MIRSDYEQTALLASGQSAKAFSRISVSIEMDRENLMGGNSWKCRTRICGRKLFLDFEI